MHAKNWPRLICQNPTDERETIGIYDGSDIRVGSGTGSIGLDAYIYIYIRENKRFSAEKVGKKEEKKKKQLRLIL